VASRCKTNAWLLFQAETGSEVCLGFFQYPEVVRDSGGNVVAESGLKGAWSFRDFINTPDQQFRTLVNAFAVAGYVANVTDDFGGDAPDLRQPAPVRPVGQGPNSAGFQR
jgi:hypothetical protein